TLVDPRLPRSAPRAARVRVEGRAALDSIEIRTAEASLGNAKANLSGKLVRAGATAPWRANGKLRLVDFDPLPWWPGSADSPLARGTNRINADSEFELALAAVRANAPVFDVLAATRGRAEVH